MARLVSRTSSGIRSLAINIAMIPKKFAVGLVIGLIIGTIIKAWIGI